MGNDLDKLLNLIQLRYKQLRKNSASQKNFIAHLKSLAKWEQNKEGDYIQIDEDSIKFPKEIFISYAVCTKECGHSEFIVDGGTQECQYCGSLMFRTIDNKYIKK